jgi:hypothetical protein
MAHYDKKLLFGGNCAPHCKDERKALYMDKLFVLSFLPGYYFERLLSHGKVFVHPS